MLDGDGRAARDAGLGYLRLTEQELVERLLADQRLVRLPLVRLRQRGERRARRSDLEAVDRRPERQLMPTGTAKAG